MGVTRVMPVVAVLAVLWLSGARAGGAALAASSGVSPYKVPSGPQAYCAPCDVRDCPPHISPEACNGTLVKDDCGCCPRCDHSQRPANLTQTSTQQFNGTCADIDCRGSLMCVLNIQDIPICRCPSVFWCRRQERREVCGRDGKTYRSKCYLKVAECTTNRKIRVAHKGQCVGEAALKKAKRKQQREQQRTLHRELQKEQLRVREREQQMRRNRRRKKLKRHKAERGGRDDRGHSDRNHDRRPKRANSAAAPGATSVRRYRFRSH